MSVKKELSGRRSIQVEVEVPGTPEEVWQAIATGPGVSSWFVPTEIDEREGGVVSCHFGPGMDSNATVMAWDPPRRFATESGDFGPNAPTLATEWIVEARGGGTCVVRVVHSLFASSDDWDDQLNDIESGWPAWFRILRLYLTHFRGQRCSTTQAMSFAPGPASEAWKALMGSLRLAGVTVGQRWESGAGAPPLAGVVDSIREGEHFGLFLRLEEPAPGIAFLMAQAMGGQACVMLHFFLYGDRAAAAASGSEPLWNAWMNQRFPSA